MATSPTCLTARAKLAQYVSDLRRASSTEKFTTAARAGLLASAKTFERNLVGNGLKQLGEHLLVRPAAVGIDYLTAVLKSAKTGGDISPTQFRTIANTLNAEGARQGLRGIGNGWRQAKLLLRTGIDPQRVGDKFDLSRVTFDNPTTQRIVSGVYNIMEAADKPFFGFGFQTDLYGRARLLALKEGLSGTAATARVNELLANPTPEMVLGATQQAAEETFKNQTALGTLGGKIKQAASDYERRAGPGFRPAAKAFKVGVDLSIPFTHVASAITNAAIETSPLGFIKAGIQAFDPNPAIQAQLQRQLARATVGSGLTYLGLVLAQKGQLTGAYPTKASEQEQWRIEGKQPYSVQINGRWRDIRFLGPYAVPVFIGQALAHEGLTPSGALEASTTLGKTITDQSYLQGLSNTIDALRGEKSAANAIASFVPVPPLVGQIGTAIDPYQRQGQTLPERLKARLPFASQTLQPRLSQFGDTLTRREPGASGVLASLLDISNPKAATETELTREMARLGVNVARLGQSVRLRDVLVKRTPAEYNALLSEFGPLKRQALEALIADPQYQRASDDEKARAFENVMRGVGRTANDVDKARRSGASVPPMTLRDLLGNYMAQP